MEPVEQRPDAGGRAPGVPADTRAGATARVARLAVRIGPDAYLIEMTSVGEIVPLAAIAPVPWTQPWFRGLANVRGRLVGVYDLPHMNGAAPMDENLAQQMLVLSDAMKSQVALLITRAFGLRDLTKLDRLPRADAARAWEGARYRDADGTVLIELDVARLIADEGFAAISV